MFMLDISQRLLQILWRFWGLEISVIVLGGPGVRCVTTEGQIVETPLICKRVG